MRPRLLIAALALAWTPLAHAQSGWFTNDVEAPDREGDVAYAAPNVAISGRIGGDAIILAGKARLEGQVDDDARVMAGRYAQTGSVGGELAVAAHNADVDGGVGDDLYIAADDVRIGPDARVGQDARIFGQTVLIKGRIDRNLDVSGETVALSAQVGGDVTIRAKHIILGPDTTIEGAFTWRAPTAPEIPADAIIAHGVRGEVIKPWRREGMWSWAIPWRNAPRAAIFAGEAAGRMMLGLSAFLIGLLAVLLAPAYADRVFETVRGRWPAAFGWGVGILVATPILALMLILTIIGIPLGFLMFFSLPLLALCGFAAGAGGLGAIVFRTHAPGGRVLALAGGLAGLVIFGLVPFFGWLLGAVTTALGLGALALALRPRPIAS
jgi:hypothetical protein